MNKLHSILRTILLLALVLIGGWWTLFLRGKLGDHEADLRDAQSTIQNLETDLQSAQETADGLSASLEAATKQLAEKDAAISGLEDDVRERDAQIEQLGVDLAASQKEVESLTAAMQLLKVDRRLARIEVLRREATPTGQRTHFRFTELGSNGAPLSEPLELTVEGTRIYIEALVIKFDDSYVEAGDFLRGTSVCLFQRVFGERQRPDEGMTIESTGNLPAVYADGRGPDPFYADLWQHFWAYAADPKAARAKGVRALHGEAPFIEARPGSRYRVVLRSSGGLSITPSSPMPRLLASILFATAACSTAASDAPTHLGLFDGPRLVGQRSGAPARDTQEAPGHPTWVRVHTAIRPEDRGPSAWPHVTRARLALPGIGQVPERGKPHELRVGSEELPLASISSGFKDPDSLPDGVFFVVNDELFLLDREGRYQDATLDYFAWIERTPRLSLFGLTANGLSLLPGESFSLDLPAFATGATETTELVFGTQVFGSSAEETAAASSTLQVAFDGKLLFAESLDPALVGTPHPHHVELPGDAEGLLTFHVEGGSGLGLFTTPVVRAKLKEPDPRPNIIVFLADTFRADNLAAWGGDPRLTPNMNAFATSGLSFTGAHAPATWTLPSQASLLTSLYPYQHQATEHSLSLPGGLATLPERLAAAGYRTAAVTDGILVTARHGLARGFDLFMDAPQEKDFDAATLDRVRTALALDDGRPLFLYVQTYRAHTPYAVTPETFAAHPELFGEDGNAAEWDFKAVFGKLSNLAPLALDGDPEGVRIVREQAAKLKRLYRGGAADLDRGFGKLLDLLQLDNTIVVLTSDHGESFLEHEALAHGTSVFEEEAHVPLVLSGPGIEAGENPSTVSLVDLAPTLVGLVGVDPAPKWIGHSLLTARGADATPTLSFMAGINPLQLERRFAWYDDKMKAVGWTRDGALLDQTPSAYNLESDPFELHDLEVDTPGWARGLFNEHQEELHEFMRARAKAVPIELTDEERANLAAMGYTGD